MFLAIQIPQFGRRAKCVCVSHEFIDFTDNNRTLERNPVLLSLMT